MIPAKKHPFETIRLRALHDLNILDTQPEASFDAITESISAVVGTPIALVSLLDRDRQWFKSRVGLEAEETPRDVAFCAHAILSENTLVVNDSENDVRFQGNPLVCGAPHVKSYLGAPIYGKDRLPLGTLCLIDNSPREWTEQDIKHLEKHAELVSILMAERSTKLLLTNDTMALSNELLERQVLLDEIGKQSGVGGWALDTETSEVSWSAETRKIHGVDENYQPTLDKALEFYAPEARPEVEACIQKAMATGNGWDFTLPIITAQNQKIWVRATGRVVDENKNSQRLVGSFQDVTIQRTRELELQAARDAAQKVCDAKDSFLANMSHEIRTPLNGLLSLIDVLAKGNRGERELQILDIMRTSGNTLNRLLTDILDLAKTEAGKSDVIEQEFDLEHVITTAAHTHKASAAGKGLDLSTIVDKGARGIWLGDAIRISQIISNLVSNAVKFTETGAVSVHADSGSKTDDGISLITVKITDSGIGFDDGDAERIFAKFEQVDATTTRKFGGTGLGLSICRVLARKMGGDVTATSSLGSGSVFTLEIPLRSLAAEKQNTHLEAGQKNGLSSDIQPSHDPAGRLKILLVEDNLLNQQVASIALEGIQHDLMIANNGHSAVEMMRNSEYDIILMDLHMPVLDGLGASKIIREEEAEEGRNRTPIIMLSADGFSESFDAALEAGADDFLTKPFDHAELVQKIRDCSNLVSENDAPIQGYSH